MILTHQLSTAFLQYIKDNQLFDRQNRLLVAVSGGLDSSVLCHLLHLNGFSFAMAHCHFGLRGAESDRDAAFVKSLAAQYGVPCFVRHFATKAFAAEHKMAIQEAARRLRYDWFAQLLDCTWTESGSEEPSEKNAAQNHHFFSSTGKPLLLTAHHQDDNIETVLMHFFKGTGIAGLRGIQPKQANIIRPLLFAGRKQLAAFAAEHNLAWMEDSSNEETKYTRNFFRHEVIPLIEARMPQAYENIGDNIRRFSETDELYKQAIAFHRKNLLEYRGNEVFIPVLKLAKTKPLQTVAYELLKPYGFSPAQTGSVLQLLHSESGRYVASASHQVVRHRRWLVVAPLQASDLSLLVIENDREAVSFAKGILHLKKIKAPFHISAEQNTAMLDEAALQFPLILRRWKQGDYFYPLGMQKKKKISRFLIDLKLSKTEKENTWVLESKKKIAWVVGLRIDDRFKVVANTKSVVQLSLSPAENSAAPRQ